jgi:hypothetical protein
VSVTSGSIWAMPGATNQSSKPLLDSPDRPWSLLIRGSPPTPQARVNQTELCCTLGEGGMRKRPYRPSESAMPTA